MPHHPVIREFVWFAPHRDSEFSTNAIGAKQNIAYDTGVVPNASPFERPDDTGGNKPDPGDGGNQPVFNEEYFEWIDILESVSNYAKHHAGVRPYVFAELGAGFGRWSVNAVQALHQSLPGSCEYIVCAVEADRQHFEWLIQNLRANRIDPDKQFLTNAPLTGDGRVVSFLTGAYGREYGQSIIDERSAFTLRATESIIGRLLRRWIAPLRRRYPPLNDKFVRKMKSTTLGEVLRKAPRVIDIADLDLQNTEAEVVEAALPEINERVMRMHIGTHSPEVEARLRSCLRQAGWVLLRDFACLGSRETPYGRIAFGDGVQSWINPRFEHGRIP